jgi:hemin uptake protein HemP
MQAVSFSSPMLALSVMNDSAARGMQPPRATSPREVNSRTLFGDAQEVRIEHHGQEYRLRQTRNGKLILTK